MQRPYGSWPSPFTAAAVAAQSVRLSDVSLDGDAICWLERRPHESGRVVLVRREADGRVRDVTPPPFNVRTRVHEYGGGACLVSDGLVWFSHFEDQRVYSLDMAAPAALPVPLTPEGRWRYADATFDARRRRLICVREDHTAADREAVTTLVALPLDGGPHPGHVLVSGEDFYSTPRLHPEGTWLAWLSWRHPAMPWDSTELWVAAVDAGGALHDAVRVAGGTDESVYQPGWSPDGTLYFVSDRTGWWQPWRLHVTGGGPGTPEPVLRQPPPRAEFGRPQWTFGTSTWTCAGVSQLVLSYTSDGHWKLAVADVRIGTLRDVPVPFEPGDWLAAAAGHVVMVAGSDTVSEAVVRVDLDTGAVETIRTAAPAPVDPACVSRPVSITCAGGDGEAVHAFYYPPVHPICVAPAGERPPLVAIGHGGPTGAASATLDLRIQFWTSRGIAVVDVNYRGSSGYGRAYRQRLRGAWGVIDVADMVTVVRHLVQEGFADPDRLAIRGGSAGGFTALAALTGHPEVFSAAASYYGVSDLEILARDTHKFESRYLDWLVGPYPERRATYRERSPIHTAGRIACPLILFQGLEDRVVPPNQSEMMAHAVRANGWPVAYLTFPGEQHGFRRAETIVRCLEAELYFYGVALGFTPADPLAPVPIT